MKNSQFLPTMPMKSPPKVSKLATVSLIFGILSLLLVLVSLGLTFVLDYFRVDRTKPPLQDLSATFVFFGSMGGLPALFLGVIALFQMKRAPLLRGKKMAVAGIILGAFIFFSFIGVMVWLSGWSVLIPNLKF